MAAARRARWGQNFLIDRDVSRHIVDWARIDAKPVIEIGPGRGALTGLLEGRASRLLLVEIDPVLVSELRTKYAGRSDVEVVESDVLRVDLRSLLDEPFNLVSNLPYESGTAIVAAMLRRCELISEMVVMLQREVAERLLAAEGGKSYGVLSIMTAIRADVEAGISVPPEAFRPRPKVWSQVLRIKPLAQPRFEVGDEDLFAELVKLCFAGRRKMLRNTLGRRLGAELGDDGAQALFDEAGVSPQLRPEQVSVARFAAISRGLHRRVGPGSTAQARRAGDA